MSLRSELESQGQWLFRWRSYLPLAFLPFICLALLNSHWPFGSRILHEYWEMICLGISFLGLGVRILVIGYAPYGTSGRNTAVQLAETLNTTGIYSVVRHPLYLGNFLIVLGAVLAPGVWWLPAMFGLGFWLYYERIMLAEEAFLRHRFGDVFEQWAAATPAFLPRRSPWKSAERSFSLRNVLKREYTGLLVVILLHTSIEIAEHLVIEHRIVYERFWETLLVGGVVSYVVLRTLKRRTSVLEVAGR